MFPSCNFVSLVVIAIDLRNDPEQHSLDSRGGCPYANQSPLAWFCVGTKTRRGRTGSGCAARPKVCRMPMTAAYAAKTPIPTEAATVARRITGIINVFTAPNL